MLTRPPQWYQLPCKSPMMVAVNYWRSVACILLLAGNSLARPLGPDASDGAAIREAVQWIQATPSIRADYQYILTCRLRLLIFWLSRDDLGGGYIKSGEAAADPNFRMIQLLFGSDPAKTPRAINRWGAGTEVDKLGGRKTPESSAFVGFMKSSQGESVAAMQQELSHEKTAGKHRFEAIISRVDGDRAVSTGVPFYSEKDYEMSQLAAAQTMALDQLADNRARKFRRLDNLQHDACGRRGGFLSTTEELLERSLREEKTPVSLCYVYNARPYTLTLERVTPVPNEDVQIALKGQGRKIYQSYRDLKESQFQIRNGETGAKTSFSVLLGTTGGLRGVPVRINYQPNWWFQIVLNLKPPAGGAAGK